MSDLHIDGSLTVNGALGSPLKINDETPIYIVKTYMAEDKSYWWRIWSDGWKECGVFSTDLEGIESGNTSTTITSINLPVLFDDPLYMTIIGQPICYLFQSSAPTFTAGHELIFYNAVSTESSSAEYYNGYVTVSIRTVWANASGANRADRPFRIYACGY